MPLYFLRHGESEANQQNLFAGRLDSPLTVLGLQQARRAQGLIAQQSIVFDEIHTSPLTRARATGAEFSAAQPTAPVEIVSEDLLERDFGILSENNKTLIKKHFGYRRYDNMFHSPADAPPGGESFAALHGRIASYFREVLKPLDAAGKTVLVVSHKYPIEIFALLAAGREPADYMDFKIPNSKPTSLDDLASHVHRFEPSVDRLGELIEIHLPLLLMSALGLGLALKLLLLSSTGIGGSIGRLQAPWLLPVLIVCTAVNTFFVFLRTPPMTIRRLPRVVRLHWPGTLLRTAVAMALIFGMRTPTAEAAGLFLLVPPTMAVPTLSLMWGGNYFLAVQLTLISSLWTPMLLLGVAAVSHLAQMPMTMTLLPFFILFAFGVGVPAVAAQGLRWRNSILAGEASTNWNWIGGAALLPMTLFGGFFFVPPDLAAHLSTPSGSGRLGGTLIAAAATLLTARLCGMASNAWMPGDAGRKVDNYLCHMAPNIFFWCSMAITGDGLFSLCLLTLYFVSLWLEDRRFVQRYAAALEQPA